MGAVAAWASVAIAAGGTAYGISQNNKASDMNQQAYQDSQEGYANRLKAAAAGAKMLGDQYNEAVKARPDLSYESFVKDKIKSLDDPFLRAFYTKAKAEDWTAMKEFADQATDQNSDNLMEVANKISGGKFKDYLKERDDLIMNTDAASRLSRTYELAAPLRTNADTVRYDEEGRLVEGQRADKQAFTVAQEVQLEAEREKKADLRQLEGDRISAAQSSVQRASEFMNFFDATGYATAVEADRTDKLYGFQALDEERAFGLYETLAAGAAGLTPTQPNYVNSGPGNALIANGIQQGTSALSNYASKQNSPSKTTYN